VRVTGLQASHLGVIAALEAWRNQFSPREWAVLVDLLARWLEAERHRLEGTRWAA
jgi:hypothetical protein